jgi:hypothetical protein
MLRIGLKHLFYVTSLLAASIGVMGVAGLVVAGIIAALWAYVFLGEPSKTTRQRMREAGISALILLFLGLCLLSPSGAYAPVAARRMQCGNNIKQICLALLNYHDVYKRFPPAVTYNEAGRPMHSWRVLILPWLEEQKLYDSYDMNEPWDGPNNAKLLNQIPRVLKCPSHDRRLNSDTTYCVVIGERTLFPPQGSRSLKDIVDGSSNTVAIVEQTKGIPWMAPLDPSIDEFLLQNREPMNSTTVAHYRSDLLTHYYSAGQLGMADGSVLQPFDQEAVEHWRRILQIDDGEVASQDLEEVEQRYFSLSRPRIEGYVALLTFIALTLLPICWIGRAPKPDTT